MDTEGLLRSLNDHSVRYVVIGAAAFPPHGFARVTLDIDIFIEPTEENAQRTHRALNAFGYDVTDLTIEELRTKKILIRQYVVHADVHPFVAGAVFDEVWQNRISAKLGETPAFFAGLEDLIRMKRAAGRPKDLEDLRALEKLRIGGA